MGMETLPQQGRCLPAAARADVMAIGFERE